MIAELFDSYLGFDCPDNTRRTYTNCLQEWVNFCEFHGINPIRADEAAAMVYKTHMYDTRLKPGHITKSTLKFKMQFLYYFYMYLSNRGIVERNIFVEIYIAMKRAKGGEVRNYRAIEDEDVNKLFIVSDSQQRAVMALFFGAAMRRAELVKIDLGDITIKAKGMEIRLKKTKAGKTQYQPIPDWAAAYIEIHLKGRRAAGAGDDAPLFMSSWKRRMSVETLGRMFKYLCERCGVLDASTHCGRVTAATKLRSNGGDLRDIQSYLRHTSLGMAQRYIRTNDAEKSKELVSYEALS